MHPWALPGESPQEGGRYRQRQRHSAQVQHRHGRPRDLPDGPLQQVGRRHLPQEGWEHMQGGQRGPEEEVAPQEPGPPLAAAREQQQRGACTVPGEQDRDIDRNVAVDPMVLVPAPGQQHDRRRQLQRGDDKEHGHRAVDESARGRLGGPRRRRRIDSRGVTGCEDRGQRAQVVEHPAAGRSGTSRTPVPSPPPRSTRRHRPPRRRSRRDRRYSSDIRALSRNIARRRVTRATAGLDRRSRNASCALLYPSSARATTRRRSRSASRFTASR